MKKVLLATTALALSAGVASAEISLSGSARMGLVHTGSKAAVQGVLTQAEIDAINTKYGTTGGAASAAVTASQMTTLQTGVTNATTAITDALSPSGSLLTQNQLDYVTAKTTLTTAQAALAAATLAQDAARISTATTDVTNAQTALDATVLAKDLASAEAKVAAATGSAGSDAKTVFDNRLQINVDASAETSSGLTFGVRSRIRINENETGALSAPRVYMKSGAVEVAVGNIYGALDSMTGMYDSEVGLTALSDAGVVLNTVGKGDWAFDNYSSQGKGVNGIEAIYSAGGFTGHLSYSEPDLSGSAAVTNKRVAAYGAYTMNDWTVALGMQDSDNNAEDKTVLTVGGKVGDYGVGFAAADNDGVQKIALNGSATFGATTVNGFVADDESGTDTALGLGVSYDLGGAAVMAGVERDAVGVNRADFGVSFSF